MSFLDIRTIGDLKAAIESYDDEQPIRIAFMGHRTCLSHNIGDVADGEETGENAAEHNTVFLLAGSDEEYLPADVRDYFRQR